MALNKHMKQMYIIKTAKQQLDGSVFLLISNAVHIYQMKRKP